MFVKNFKVKNSIMFSKYHHMLNFLYSFFECFFWIFPLGNYMERCFNASTQSLNIYRALSTYQTPYQIWRIQRYLAGYESGSEIVSLMQAQEALIFVLFVTWVHKNQKYVSERFKKETRLSFFYDTHCLRTTLIIIICFLFINWDLSNNCIF